MADFQFKDVQRHDESEKYEESSKEFEVSISIVICDNSEARAALKNGPMAFQALAREINNPASSLPQFLEPLLEKHKVIRTARGIYALAGTAPVYVPTSDAIISALTKKAMKLGLLVHRVNKLTKTARSQSTIRTVLSRLKEEGKVKQDRPLGEYRLARSVRAR